MKLRKLLIHSSVIQIMPGLGLVPMMLQMNLNKLLFLMIDSNPKIKETKQVFTSEITDPPPDPPSFCERYYGSRCAKSRCI